MVATSREKFVAFVTLVPYESYHYANFGVQYNDNTCPKLSYS